MDCLSLDKCRYDPKEKTLTVLYTDLKTSAGNLWEKGACYSNRDGAGNPQYYNFITIKSHVTGKEYEFRFSHADVKHSAVFNGITWWHWELFPNNSECPVKILYVVDDSARKLPVGRQELPFWSSLLVS